MNKILLVDDDHGLADLLAQLLELEGFVLTLAYDGHQGLEMALMESFDLILLDVMLPKMNGFDLLKQLRLKKQTPVVMLTARGDEIDRVVGLEIGADDYLPKPFNDRELVARVRAVLRRSQITAAGDMALSEDATCYEDLTLDPRRQEAYCDDLLLDLTGSEFALLHELVANMGEMVSKENLSVKVLGKKLTPYDRSLDMHLSNLRKKLPERKDQRPRVKTVRGKGYIWLP